MPDTPQAEEQPKHAGGRPLLFESADALAQAIQSYFDDCDPHIEKRLVESGVNQQGETIFQERRVMTEQKPYTVSGLARALGTNRQTLLNYAERPEFFDTLDDAKERCHAYAESQLFGKSASGASFSLKNNWGWEDKKSVDHTTKGQAMPLLGGTTPLPDEEDEDGS